MEYRRYDNGDVYEGDLVNDVPNGKGKYTTANGNVFECDWVDGKPHGKGKVTYAEGGYYEGDFLDGLRHGKGKVTLRSGSIYEGEWFGDNWHGKGKYTMANGNVYEGNFVDDELHNGKMITANGDVYEGDLVKCEPYGKGRMTYSDGRVEEGKWKEGEFIGMNNVDPEEAKKALEDFQEASKRLDEDKASFTAGSKNKDEEQLIEQALSLMFQDKYEESASLFEKAAVHGHMGAQYALGELYEYGRVGSFSNGNPNTYRAAKWYKEAAKQGHPDAQNNLGVMYLNGDGVSENPTRAKYLFKKAAKQGNELAQKNLYKCDFGDTKKIVFSILCGLTLGIILAVNSKSFFGFLGGMAAGWIIVSEIRKRI